MAEEANHERQTDGGFGRRHRHHEERDDLAVHGSLLPSERERMSRFPGGIDVMPLQVLKLHGSINWVSDDASEPGRITVAPIVTG